MKAIMLLLVLGAATGAAQAQVRGLPAASDYSEGGSTTSRNSGFGIKGGLSLSDLQGSGTSVFTNREQLRTFHVGVYGQHGFTHFASVQVELLYARKGFQQLDLHRGKVQVELLYARKGFQAYADSLKNQVATQLNYLEVPVLFVGNITETLSFHVGPQVSVLTGARGGGQPLDLGRGGYRRLDFGGIVGAEARLGPARLGVRYDLSLANLYKSGSSVYYSGRPLGTLLTDNNIRNEVLQVYLGIGLAH